MKGWLWVLWLVLLISLGLNVGLLLGKPRGRPVEPPAETPPIEVGSGRLESAAARLGLEGEERARFVAQQRRFIATVVLERRRLERLRQEVRRELRAARPDRERLEALVRQSGAAYAALDGAFVDNIVRTRELLDPQQERAYLRFLGRMRARALGRQGSS